MINIHKWRIFGLAILVTLITVLVVLNIRSQYSATATLLIESQQAKAVSIEEVYGMNSSQQEYYLTQFEILKSRSIAQTVVEKMDLTNHPDFEVKPGLMTRLRDLLPFLPTPESELTEAELAPKPAKT